MKNIKSVRNMFVAALALAAFSGCTGKGGSDPGGSGGVAAKSEPLTVGKFETATGKQLKFPVRVAPAGDLVFVSDNQANQVLGFGDGPQVALTGLDQPLGLAVFGDLVYVGNVGRKDVEVYSLSAKKYLRSLGGAGAFEMPNSIAVAPDGTVYVADSKKNVVEVFSADGAPVQTIGSAGSGDGQFNFPAGVAVDATRLVVGDQANHRIQIFKRTGEFIRAFGQEIPSDLLSRADYKGKFTRIASVALAGDSIYVLDSAHSYVQVLDELGHSKGFMGNAGACDNCITLGLDIALDGKGGVFATDPENHRWVSLSTELR